MVNQPFCIVQRGYKWKHLCLPCFGKEPIKTGPLRRIFLFLEVFGLDKKDVERLVQNAAKDGRLSCEKAHQLADEHGLDLKEVGEAADKLKIKIYACQLGCF